MVGFQELLGAALAHAEYVSDWAQCIQCVRVSTLPTKCDIGYVAAYGMCFGTLLAGCSGETGCSGSADPTGEKWLKVSTSLPFFKHFPPLFPLLFLPPPTPNPPSVSLAFPLLSSVQLSVRVCIVRVAVAENILQAGPCTSCPFS